MSYPRQLKSMRQATDPFASDVYFLAHYDTNFNDVVFGQVGTGFGAPNPSISGALPKFGAGSFQQGGSNSGVFYPGAGSDNLWNGDITFEFWMRKEFQDGNNRNVFGTDLVSGGGAGSFRAGINISGIGELHYNFRGADVATGFFPVLNQYYAIAITHGTAGVPNAGKLFVDGVITHQTTPAIGRTSAAAFVVGNDFAGTLIVAMKLDELRITRNIRYTINYTPATAAFTWP